jgi:hypothetical protein
VLGEWVTLVVVLVVAMLMLNIRRPTNATVVVDRDEVNVRLGGWDVAFCLRRQITIPLGAVEGVCVGSRDLIPTEGLRLPGTSIPGIIRAGSFGTGDQRDFWDVRKAQNLLVVQMRPGAAEYRRIILEVPDPRAELARLRPLLGPAVLPLADAL